MIADTTPLTPRLREDVEVVVGMDGMTLLYDPQSGVYHRLGALAARVVGLFDGVRSISDIVNLLNLEASGGRTLQPAQVEGLVRGLAELQLLAGGKPAKPRRSGFDRMLPRFIVMRSFSKVLAPFVNALRPLARPIPVAIAVLLSLAGYVIGIVNLSSSGIAQLETLDAGQLFLSGLIAAPIQMFAILLHESWHGIIAGMRGQPVRGLGIALMFWVFPVAYVDRTDAYRLRDRRSRVAIALAGMVNDGWLMGVTGLVAMNSQGLVNEVAVTLLWYQTVLLIANLNPLAPSDTVSAIEAATGLVDLRGRSQIYVRSTVMRRELPQFLRGVGTSQKILYLGYGLFSYLFALWVVGFMLWGILTRIFSGVGS